tara:strand:- start:3808 stop:4716 length:909 start_codon:yes stop_codon:yes gene_type:complete
MVDIIKQLANNDAFRNEYSDFLTETASTIGNNLYLEFGDQTTSLMKTGDGPNNDYKYTYNSYINLINNNVIKDFSNNRVINDLDYGSSFNNIKEIFNYIKPSVKPNDLLKNKIFADETDNQINNIFYLYYDNIKKLKDFRDDISYNIDTARKLFHKLNNYTHTNPNLHLLSKSKDKLQNKIDSYEKHMNIDSKLNKELEINIENNKNYNYYLLIIYYVILILFFIFSNFMKNKYYKNPVATIMIILYIIAPFIIKYILLYMYKFYLYIMKKFNLLNTGLTYEDIVKYDSYNYENNQENISYI